MYSILSNSTAMTVVNSNEALAESSDLNCQRVDYDTYWFSEVVARYFAALSGPTDPIAAVAAGFEEISHDLRSHGLEILLDSGNLNQRVPSLSPTVDTQELQAFVDELYNGQIRRGYLILSEFMTRIWCSTRILPSQVRFEGVKAVSLYPFATTATSNVYQGVMENGALVAMKTLRESVIQPASIEDFRSFFFEAAVSSAITHRNIMASLGIYVDRSGNIYLVSKFQKHGSLPEYLSRQPAIDRLLMLEEVASAVAHLHSLSPPILHGDIHGTNVLIDDFGEPLLMDMGYSLAMNPLTSTFAPYSHLFIGNPRWTPWEKIHRTEFPLTLKADSFSFGSLMLETLTGDVPYRYIKSNSALIAEFLVRRRLPKRPENPQLPDVLWDLMMKCWSLNPALRPTMEEIYHRLVSIRSQLALDKGESDDISLHERAL